MINTLEIPLIIPERLGFSKSQSKSNKYFTTPTSEITSEECKISDCGAVHITEGFFSSILY